MLPDCTVFRTQVDAYFKLTSCNKEGKGAHKDSLRNLGKAQFRLTCLRKYISEYFILIISIHTPHVLVSC